MSPRPANDADLRRRSVRRTVLWLAALAVLVYGGFILSGVFGFAGGAAP